MQISYCELFGSATYLAWNVRCHLHTAIRCQDSRLRSWSWPAVCAACNRNSLNLKWSHKTSRKSGWLAAVCRLPVCWSLLCIYTTAGIVSLSYFATSLLVFPEICNFTAIYQCDIKPFIVLHCSRFADCDNLWNPVGKLSFMWDVNWLNLELLFLTCVCGMVGSTEGWLLTCCSVATLSAVRFHRLQVEWGNCWILS